MERFRSDSELDKIARSKDYETSSKSPQIAAEQVKPDTVPQKTNKDISIWEEEWKVYPKAVPTVLIVNQSREVCLELVEMLENDDFMLDYSCSSYDAISKVRENRYELFLLDTEMLDMDGFELAEIILQRNISGAPLIFLSSNYVNNDEILRGLELGAIDFISKPFETEIVRLKIRNHFITASRKKELLNFQKKLEEVLDVLSKKTKDLNDSIQYASLIQRRVLQKIEVIEREFDDTFLIYEPKEAIGGDFYFMEEVNNRLIIVCADSTGHSVSGAMLSMLGYQLISKIIKEQRIFDPGKILNVLSKGLLTFFGDDREGGHHCMDVAVVVYRFEGNTVDCASAKRPIVIVDSDETRIVKGDNYSVGDTSGRNLDFKTTSFKIEKDCWIYLFSDGFTDQFGGSKIKKLGRQRLIKLLQEQQGKNARKQKNALMKAFSDWKGEEEQTDDTIMIGKKLSAIRRNTTAFLDETQHK